MPAKPPTFRPGGKTDREHKRERAREWQRTRKDGDIQRLYRSKRWRALREVVLARFPACVYCRREGRVTPSTVVDHVKPHRRDMALFWDLDNLHGLCTTCHSSAKQREERRTD